MATNGYISLNGDRYYIKWGTYKPIKSQAASMSVGLSGKTITQDFDFIDYRWTAVLLVRVTEADSNYGNLSDLETAYSTIPCAFIDPDGNSHNVLIDGDLPEEFKHDILDNTIPNEIPVMLRKVQA